MADDVRSIAFTTEDDVLNLSSLDTDVCERTVEIGALIVLVEEPEPNDV